jgi:hypothetical protein
MVMASLTLLPAAAVAGDEWCAEDPILEFANGTRLQLIGWYPSAYANTVTGPVVWEIEVPANIGPVLVTKPSSAIHAEQVTLLYTGATWRGGTADIRIHATILVSASVTFPLQLAVYGDTSTTPTGGDANEPVTIAARTRTGAFTPYQGILTGTSVWFTETATMTVP